ncbi:C6 transcription factor, putative [Trichophyton verrucosum HKI 0517]|uniref:C6 transcription factor, putative n=1 Tax=Trichophyton verrucosum (strain HKI 0517) TaxID=663202 RepID=D4D3F2_TRIVH|nr:C6 transcription factor, putative [Trichophyton verrucosum HKI 0517]EFE43650.1 C6 transcription factor, putative [Trichophyton verrucosum HKI 0517]
MKPGGVKLKLKLSFDLHLRPSSPIFASEEAISGDEEEEQARRRPLNVKPTEADSQSVSQLLSREEEKKKRRRARLYISVDRGPSTQQSSQQSTAKYQSQYSLTSITNINHFYGVHLLTMQCHTCRKRRVRCDGALPACQKCRDRGLDCLGYGKQKPLVWLAGGGHQNAFLDDRQKARKKGRPRLVVDSPGSSRDAKDKGVKDASTAVVVAPRAVPESMMFSYPAEIQKVVRTIWYYEHELVPDLDPINHVDVKAAEDPTAWQDDLASILWHVLICAVDTHKAIRSQPDSMDSGVEVQVGREVYRSKSHTLRRISRNIADPETRISDVTLVGVLTLFMAETQLSAVGSWQTHFQGACHIIRMRGGVRTIARHSAGLNSLLTFFMIADVMSYTTISSSLPMLDARRQLEYTDIIQEVYQDGSGTCIPCPNQLFDAIIRINHLRALAESYSNSTIIELQDLDREDASPSSSSTSTTTSSSTSTLKTSIHALLQDILSFPIASWADTMHQQTVTQQQASSCSRLDPKKAFLRPDRPDWVRIASIYHAATAIYCVRSLGHLLDQDQLLHVSFSASTSTPTASYVSVSDILLVARKILLETLREVLLTVSDPRKSFVKVMLWPMFVAGVEAAVDSRPETVQFRSLLESVLRRLCRSLGTLSICGLRNFLLSLWEHARLHPHLWSWSELMALSPGRSVFFM